MHHLTFKTLLATALICFFNFSSAFAQETVPDSSIASTTVKVKRHLITIAPLGLINKVRLRYEYAYSKKASIGFQFSHYYDIVFPGFQAVITGRYYLSHKPAPLGFYIVGQAGWAQHSATAYEGIYQIYSGRFFSLGSDYGYTSSHRVRSNGLVSGLCIGYQHPLGSKKRWLIDSYLGAKYLVMNNNLNAIYVDGSNGGLASDFFQQKYNTQCFSQKDGTGIGGFLNCGINVGYRF